MNSQGENRTGIRKKNTERQKEEKQRAEKNKVIGGRDKNRLKGIRIERRTDKVVTRSKDKTGEKKKSNINFFQ